MLERSTAIRFHRPMTSGKTRPCLLTCQLADGVEVEAVVKCSAGCERGVGGLVVEAIAAMLAADLDLPVPRPLLVAFDSDFPSLVAGSDPESAARLAISAP
jgi:hypothetical protein